MIRPEARAALWRWREALAGGGVVALGLYWSVLTGDGLLRWIGAVAVLAGAALALAGLQRGRFRQGGRGPGLVRVVEGRIGYFGPSDGGTVDLADIVALSLDPSGDPPCWKIERRGGPPLDVPVTADGADQLFDVFARLPGLRTEQMLGELRGGATRPVQVWRAEPEAARHRRLH